MDLIIDSQIVQSLLLIVIFLAILVEIKTGGIASAHVPFFKAPTHPKRIPTTTPNTKA